MAKKKNNKAVEEIAKQEEVVVEAETNATDTSKKEEKKDKSNAKKDKKVVNKKKTTNEGSSLGKKARATVSELKKVTWPTFGQLVKNTGVVLAFVLLFVVLLLGVNALFGWLFELVTGLF